MIIISANLHGFTKAQREQFGRNMMQPGGPGNAPGAQSDGTNGGSQDGDTAGALDMPDMNGANGTGADGTDARGGQRPDAFGRVANYISDVNATVNLSVVGIMLLIGLALTLMAAVVAAVFVMRYEPLQILTDRS